jgi:iron complex outermembrane recepter protein
MRMSARYRRCFATIGLIVSGVIAAPWAFAETMYSFNLPEQSLADSLRAIGQQTAVNILFEPEAVKNARSPALRGQYTVDEAIRLVLAGTKLEARHTAASNVVIKARAVRTDASPPTSADAPGILGSRLSQSNPGSSQSAADDQTIIASDPKSEQSQREGLSEIIVTGTHIRGNGPIGAPIVTLDSEAIAQTGYTTTQQLIQALPQNFRGGAAGASADANFSGGANNGFNGAFGSGINLRGLGNTATLVLVNGHRVASSGGGYFTDISSIPLSAIDHVDVLTDGASAIYGSDAIAGVVNIVLKRESQGVEVGARYGAADGFSTEGGNLGLGREWARGGATIDIDFSHQGTLDSSERSFTSSIGSPTSILPAYHQTAISAASHQSIGDRIEVHGDAQYAEKEVTDFISAGVPTVSQYPKVDRWSGSAGASYQISDTWNLRYDASGGVGVENMTVDESGFLSAYSFIDKETSRFSDQTAAASGGLFLLPAGRMKLALGVSYRTEEFSRDERLVALGIQDNVAVHRNVKASYGELLVPVVSDVNAFQGFQKLTLSVAVRRDDYSDFGGTTNPKYGVSWFPISTLQLRAAYSTSFRAPAAGVELVNSKAGTTSVSVYSLNGPDNGPAVPVVFLGGARPNLGPETASNLTVGLDFKPTFAPGLQVMINYYDISYANQLANPPFSINALNTAALGSVITRYPTNGALQAVVNSAIQSGAFYSDSTGGAFGPDPLSSAVYLYDGRIQNIAATKTSGFDVEARHRLTLGTARIDTSVEATYIDKFAVTLTPDSSPLSEVNTVGYPARLRMRGQATWTHDDLAVTFAANYVGSYPDTSATVLREVGSYTTFDMTARYEIKPGVAATFAVANILNRLPPFVESGAINFPGSHYDPANANPVGRALALGLSKRW